MFFISCVWCFVTCAGFPVVPQSVSRQTEAVVGARGALTDVLTAVLQLQAQIHTCSRDDIDFSVQSLSSCRVIIGVTDTIFCSYKSFAYFTLQISVFVFFSVLKRRRVELLCTNQDLETSESESDECCRVCSCCRCQSIKSNSFILPCSFTVLNFIWLPLLSFSISL